MDDATPAGPRKRARREGAPTTPDPIEIAMEAEAGDTSPDNPARRLLVRQEKLIERQTALTGWQIASERAGFGLKALIGVAAAAAVALLLGLAWTASRADGLVVEAFTVPPDLAAKGLTGQVVASQVLDRFNIMQREDESLRPEKGYANAWGQEARIEIPQTGVSLGELQRYLRQWLGHQRQVSGEVFRTPQGLQLSLRVSGAEADTLSGSEADLNGLFTLSAQHLYSRTDPPRYASYLSRRDPAAARAFLAPLIESGPAEDRAYAMMILGNLTDDPIEALALYDRSGKLGKFSAGVSAGNAASRYAQMGKTQLALDTYRRAIPAFKFVENTAQGPVLRTQMESQLASLVGDYSRAYALWMAGPNARRMNRATAPTTRARILANLHEPGRAAATLGPRLDDGEETRKARGVSTILATLARERGDWLEAQRQLDLITTAVADPIRRSLSVSTTVAPRRAEALAQLGRFDEARAIIQSTPADCYLCLRMRGRVAALAGAPAEADRWYAEAVRQAPDLPQAEAEWGEVLLARGDFVGSAAKATKAYRKSPNFADPIEVLGEALLAAGDASHATARFAEAAKLTPRWGRLHLKWGEALANLGKSAEAQAHWRTAAKLDLTASERAELASVQGAK